ncbi:MAG: hypothetical protein K5663_10860 [Clostridiales bacterium]|nr:hypothetical protein [Clostridiales bacterium]
MKQLRNLYPHMNDTDDSSYIYYTDDGRRIHLTARQNGVTEEHIAALKEMHRKEARSEHYSKRYRRNGDHYETTVCSLDGLCEETGGDSICFIDEHSDCELLYLEAEARGELLHRLTSALSEMSEEQRALFEQVWIQKLSVRQIAMASGISEQAVRAKMSRIVKRLKI